MLIFLQFVLNQPFSAFLELNLEKQIQDGQNIGFQPSSQASFQMHLIM